MKLSQTLEQAIDREMDANYDFFQTKKLELMKTHKNKFVLIRKKKFIGFFDSYEDADQVAVEQYGENGLYSIQKITDEIIIIGGYEFS